MFKHNIDRKCVIYNLMDWLTFKEKGCCHCKIIPQWKTPCVVFIPIFFIALKLNISFIFHVLRFEGIIFAINVVYDLEVLVQIDTACARVYKWDLSSSSQQWGPHFPFVW